MVDLRAASAAEAERNFGPRLPAAGGRSGHRFFNRPCLAARFRSSSSARQSLPNQVSIIRSYRVASTGFFAERNFMTGALCFQLELSRLRGWRYGSRLSNNLASANGSISGRSGRPFQRLAGIGNRSPRPTIGPALRSRERRVGVLLASPVIVRALRRPAAQRGPLLNKLLDATANRDFSVLLLALALWGRMDLFLWMAGIGIHVFWIALLALQAGRPTPIISRESA